MRVRILLSALAAALITSTAYGYGYPDAIGMGSSMPGTDAVSHGFAGASAVNVGGMNLFGNPSGISGSNLMLNAGALILKQTVDDGLGKHSLTYAGLGITGLQASLQTGPVSIAAGVSKIRDYTYTGEYFFIEGELEPIISGFEDLTVEGGIWEAAFGAAGSIAPGVRLGAAAGYRTGKVDYEYYMHHFSESIEDSISTWSREEGEFAWRAGTTVLLGNGAEAGLFYASESDNCPAHYGAGVVFGEISRGDSGVGVEAKIYDTEGQSAWTGTVFGGIHADRNLFFRGGLNLTSKGVDESNVSLGLSLGATVNFSWMDLNAAFNFNNENRNGLVFGFPQAETITDVITGFTVGATIPL